MSDTRISDLAAQTNAGLATDDVLVVVDRSDTTMAASGTNKKLAVGELDLRYQPRDAAPTPLSKLATTKKLTYTSGFTTPGAGFEALLFQVPYVLSSTATGGTFTLTWNGHTTGSLNWNDTATTIYAALAALTGWAGGGTAKGGPLNTAPVNITPGQYNSAQLAITINSSLTGGTATMVLPGSGMIENIHIALSAATMNQDTRLRIRTDGNSTPDIDIDLGTLFLSHNDAQTAAKTRRTSGTSTFSAQSSLVVTHGIGNTPLEVFAGAISTQTETTLEFWVDTITETQFTIHTLGNYSGTVAWEAISQDGLFASTQHMQVGLRGTPNNDVNYQIRYPIPFTSGAIVSLYNVNNSDTGTGGFDLLYSLAATAPYRLMSAGSTWKNGGTQAAPTPVLTVPGTAYTLANISGLAKGGIPVWATLCQQGIAPTLVQVNATGGTFTLTWNGHTTSAIAWNASAGTVLTALQALTGWVAGGTTTTTGAGLVSNPGVYIQQNTNAPLAITADSTSLTGGTHTATVTNTAGTHLAPYTYLERPISITPDGDATASFATGATEDFFQQAWYHQSAKMISTPTTVVTCANNANATANQGLDLLEMCGGLPCNSSFVWTLGVSASNHSAMQMSYCLLYYKGV